MMNRLSAVYLPYTVGIRDLASFYRDAWGKGRDLLASGRNQAR
jgi:hypothetical protein